MGKCPTCVFCWFDRTIQGLSCRLKCCRNHLERLQVWLTEPEPGPAPAPARWASRRRSVRFPGPDKFAEISAPSRWFRCMGRCFTLGSTFIDLSAKVDSLPSSWRHPARRTHGYRSVTVRRHRKNISLDVYRIWDG